MADIERIVNDGRGPRFQPNRRLSAPYQYGKPISVTEVIVWFLLILACAWLLWRGF